MTTDREALVKRLTQWEEGIQYADKIGVPLDSRALLKLVVDCKAALSAQGGEQSAEMLAQRFHEAYERLAPQFGYVTRKETREFDKETSNGRLMIAVCDEIIRGHDRQALKKSAEMVSVPREPTEAMRISFFLERSHALNECPYDYAGAFLRGYSAMLAAAKEGK